MDNHKELIERLRTESLYKDKATLEIMDLCMEAADALGVLMEENAKLKVKAGELEAKNHEYQKENAQIRAKLKQVKREWDTAAEILEGWKTTSRPTRTLA